jgi:integrase
MCYPRKNKDGEIVSFRFHFSGKDPLTDKPKQYTATWKIPKGLSQKEIELERKKAEIEFITESEKKSNGIFIQENHITFEEFANKWHERILLRNSESYGYYVKADYTLKILNQYFGKCLLRNISPIMIQRFYDWLCERTCIKEIVTVKKSIFELVEEQGLNKTTLAKELGLDRLTVRLATKIGQQVSMTTAKAISKRFEVPLSKYFNVEKKEVKYAKSTNAGIRTFLVIILGEAKRQMLIEHNYASREYTRPMNMGFEKPKEIFNEEEAREFVRAILKEPHQKKRTVFALFIFLGLRKAEVCGLSWGDIDFENKTLSVRRNNLYFSKFGVVTKGTKTKNSQRTIKLPNELFKILTEYKIWYDEKQIIFGDLLIEKENLFLQDNGKPLHPCTVNLWLRKFNTAHGFKHIPPHSLRHTCITMKILSGAPLKLVSLDSGHSNERITLDIYTHATQGQADQAAENYNTFLLG